jgi:hypothetical protein
LWQVDSALNAAEGLGEVHPLLLAEAWYRVALVFHHHQKRTAAVLRAAVCPRVLPAFYDCQDLVLSVLTDSALGPQAKAAAKAVDLSPNPHVEAVLLAFQTAKLAADGAAANGYLRRCETPEGQPGSVPGCASRLAELRGGGGGGGAE